MNRGEGERKEPQDAKTGLDTMPVEKGYEPVLAAEAQRAELGDMPRKASTVSVMTSHFRRHYCHSRVNPLSKTALA